MCLSIVSSQRKKPTAQVVKAWKEFLLSGGESLGYLYMGGVVVSEAWLRARRIKVTSNAGRTYTSGFHAYAYERKRKNPRSNIVCLRVLLRGVRTRGFQGWPRRRVLVADEMYVPKQRKRALREGAE